MEEAQETRKAILNQWSFSGNSEQPRPAPQTFRRVLFNYWMKFARILGIVNTNILLTLFYVIIIGPMAVMMKLWGKDLLDRKAEERSSYWYDKESQKPDLERSKHQF